MADLDIREGLVVHPGDTLVVRFRSDITRAEFDEFCKRIEEQAPEGVKVLMVNAEELAVLRGQHA